MKELFKSIKPLVQEELERANEKFPQFASAHEGYAVLLEEVQEATDEMESVADELETTWVFTRANRTEDAKRHLQTLKKDAVNLIAEAIQVAAMAQKFIDMLEREEK